MALKATAETKGKNQNWERINAFLSKYGIVLILLAMFIAFSLLSEGFATPRNIFNIIRQISFMGLIAIGVTMAIITGGIDLGSGSVLALCAVIATSLAPIPESATLKYEGLSVPILVPILVHGHLCSIPISMSGAAVRSPCGSVRCSSKPAAKHHITAPVVSRVRNSAERRWPPAAESESNISAAGYGWTPDPRPSPAATLGRQLAASGCASPSRSPGARRAAARHSGAASPAPCGSTSSAGRAPSGPTTSASACSISYASSAPIRYPPCRANLRSSPRHGDRG